MDNYSRRSFMKAAAGGILGLAGLSSCQIPFFTGTRGHTWRKYEITASSGTAWLNNYKGKVSERDFKLLERAQQTLLNNILIKPDPACKDVLGAAVDANQVTMPWAPYRGIAPSPFGYRGVWNWDCAFHAIGAARWDAELARDQVRIFLKNQLATGALPDVVFENGKVVASFGKPPVMPWACVIIDRHSPDDEFLRIAYEKFVAYEAHWRRDRGGDRDGLFHYGGTAADHQQQGQEAKLESGWDTSVRWDKASCDLWAIDLNCFMLMLYQSMAYMADRLGNTKDIEMWQRRRQTLASKINEKLWNNAASAYMDYNFVTNEFNGVLSPASFMPLYTRIASKDQAAGMAKLAADPNKFYPGMPTVSYDDPQYRSGDYWRGPAWLNTSYWAIKGLYLYGYDQTADSCRETLLNWCAKNKEYMHEYYDSKTGQGLGAKQYGWTSTFVIEFILNWNKNDDL